MLLLLIMIYSAELLRARKELEGKGKNARR